MALNIHQKVLKLLMLRFNTLWCRSVAFNVIIPVDWPPLGSGQVVRSQLPTSLVTVRCYPSTTLYIIIASDTSLNHSFLALFLVLVTGLRVKGKVVDRKRCCREQTIAYSFSFPQSLLDSYRGDKPCKGHVSVYSC